MRYLGSGLRLFCLAVTSLLAGTVEVQAEIGVIFDLGSPSSPGAFYTFTIIEDPHPIGGVWLRYSAPDANRAVLNAEGAGEGDGPPSLLRQPVSGMPMAAWARNLPTDYDIVLSRFTGSAWSEPEVLAGSPLDELDPVLVASPDGSVHLFYWENGTTPRILYREAPSDLSSWSAPIQVSEQGLVACRPAAVFHDGILRVVYEVHDYGFGQTPRQVVVVRYEGGEFIREIVGITHNEGPAWPQVHSRSGRLWVDWIDATAEMAWTRNDAQGAWEPIQSEPFTSQEQLEFFVRGTIRYLATE